MVEIFHVGALVPAAVGACCIAVDRRWGRAPDLVAALVMMWAMLDVMFWSQLAPVFWSAILLGLTLVLTVMGGRGRSRGAAGRGAAGAGAAGAGAAARLMRAHSSLGLVVMAVIVVAMVPVGSVSVPDAAAHHHGGAAATSLVAVSVVASVAYGVWSVAASRLSGAAHAHVLTRRTQWELAAMGISTAAMGAALVV